MISVTSLPIKQEKPDEEPPTIITDEELIISDIKVEVKEETIQTEEHINFEEIKWLSCDKCNFKAKTRKALTQHSKNHDPTNWFYCYHCPFKSRRKGNLESHILYKHTTPEKINWLHCDKCTYRAKSVDFLKKHLKYVHTQEKKYVRGNPRRCDYCSFTSTKKAALKIHVLKKHTDLKDLEWFKCEQCPFQTQTMELLSKHTQRHSRDVKITLGEEIDTLLIRGDDNHFSCKYCQYKSILKCNLRRHIVNKHTDPKNLKWYKCGQCPYNTTRKEVLKLHMTHKHCGPVNVNWIQCSQCPYEAKTQELLTEHLKTHKTEEKNSPTAPVFLKVEKLLIREVTEDYDKNFQCKHCLYIGFDTFDIHSHVIDKHTDSSSDFDCIRCPLCHSVVGNDEIVKHWTEHEKNVNVSIAENLVTTEDEEKLLLTHVEEIRPNKSQTFTCDLCPYKTTHIGNFRRHTIHKHTDPEEIEWLECPHCSHQSKTYELLSRHLKRHTKKVTKKLVTLKIRPQKYLTCEHCPYKTVHHGNLNRHMIHKHTDPKNLKLLQCPQCQFQTKTAELLSRHLVRHDENVKRVEVVPNSSKYGYDIDEQSNPKRFICKNCTYQTSNKTNIKRHIMHRHTNDEDLPWIHCPRCEYRSKTLELYSRHWRKYHEVYVPVEVLRIRDIQKEYEGEAPNIFSCGHCLYQTFDSFDIKRHIVYLHSDSEDDWVQCPLCPSIIRNSELVKHWDEHDGENVAIATDLVKIEPEECEWLYPQVNINTEDL